MQSIDIGESYEQSELYKLRHAGACGMGQAVLELYPDAKLGIGLAIDDGFYCDFELFVIQFGFMGFSCAQNL